MITFGTFQECAGPRVINTKDWYWITTVISVKALTA